MSLAIEKVALPFTLRANLIALAVEVEAGTPATFLLDTARGRP